ncbi:MAG: hypothetical protein ACOCRX_05580 [Candidatus Woesearchaeota archaeon]
MRIKPIFVLSSILGIITSFVVYGSVSVLCNALGSCKTTAWLLPLIPLFLGLIIGFVLQKFWYKGISKSFRKK